MRVLTFNIRGGRGMDGRRTLTRVANVISSAAPDVVCLQEVHQRVPWSGLVNQPRQLETLLGWPVVFGRHLTIGIGGEGVAIATRFGIASAVRHRLPSVRERRGVLEARLETPTGPVTVFNTHWGLQENERTRQAADMARRINAATGPILVCGDFNERADGAAVRQFLKETGLRDADAPQNRPTYPADAPRARIDYVFFSAHWHLESVMVLADASASDHRPVVADLRLAPSEPNSPECGKLSV